MDLTVRSGPPLVGLRGRGGVGKTVLGAALRARSVPVLDGAGPADALLYCLAGGVRAVDRVELAALDAGPVPVVVAWCKADAVGSWRAADDYAAGLAEVLQRPVIPVMALLDGAGTVDLGDVRRLATSDLALPASALEAASALGADAPLLRRLGGYGLACAIGALRESPSMPDAALLASLRELSGVDALLEPLGTALAGYADRREIEFDDALRTVVATDCARRDHAEQALLDRLGRAS